MIDYIFYTICSTSISPKKLWQWSETSYIWSRKIHEASVSFYAKCNLFFNSLYDLFLFWLHVCVFLVMYYTLSWRNLWFGCIICRWLSSKEIDQEAIKYWRRKIPHLMCEMKKYPPLLFFNAQEHYLIHQV